MDLLPFPLYLFTYLLITTCKLSNPQKLSSSHDIFALAKMLHLPYFPYFLPKLSLLETSKRTKLYGLPPLPTLSPDMQMTTSEIAIVPNRTTFPPLLRLFTLPLITLPPPPKIDSYGINTIPELPPQHESIYKGMFAPDGSLIEKKNTTVKDKDKQTETNQIYDHDGLERFDTSARGIRMLNVRAADGPIIDDDYDWHTDERVSNNHKESMFVANFLRKAAVQDKKNLLKQSMKTIKDEKMITSPSRLRSVSGETSAIDSAEMKPKVKSSTFVRLRAFASNENDGFKEKNDNFYFVPEAGRQKPHRIFPRSDRSPAGKNSDNKTGAFDQLLIGQTYHHQQQQQSQLPIQQAQQQQRQLELQQQQQQQQQVQLEQLQLQQQQQPVLWNDPNAPVQNIPQFGQYYDWNSQYQSQQQQQLFLRTTRNPQDAAYLREVEDYDHFWEAENARTAAYHQTLTTVSPVFREHATNVQLPQETNLQPAEMFMSSNYQSRTSQQQYSPQFQQLRAYAPQIYNNNEKPAGLRELNSNAQSQIQGAQSQSQNVAHFATLSPIPAQPQLQNGQHFSISSQSRPSPLYPMQGKQQPLQRQQLSYPQNLGRQSGTLHPLDLPPNPLKLDLGSLSRTLFGGLLGNNPQA